ncbi:VC0807 family protein [Burkholderia sp. L27(2015)]|uniref:VC0807 family protein n=1 Tax=Burkholderia sp. L27(2015) TaxID=1641858 RepID=UPI00131D71C5|nr:VC0807 family protein [Burkholderia sp. L27(2015)]
MKPILRFLAALLVNAILPWVTYRLMVPHVGVTWALAASALPMLAWIFAILVRYREFDALSATLIASICLAIVLIAFDHPTRPLLPREPVIRGIIGIAFLLSLALRRPLIYYLARSTLVREHGARGDRFETLWNTRAEFRHALRIMTAVWGAGLLLEDLLRTVISQAWADARAPLLSTSLSYAIYGCLAVWTTLYRRRITRQRDHSDVPA